MFLSAAILSSELIQQRLGVLQIGDVEART
jgi:hypothetical protein